MPLSRGALSIASVAAAVSGGSESRNVICASLHHGGLTALRLGDLP
jgi:hypothetical protein